MRAPRPWPVTVTDGSIMLGGDAWADVEWTCDSHALGYRVYGCQGAGCEPRFLGWVKQPTHVQVCGYDDMGFADASEMVAVGPNPASAGPYSRTLLGQPIVPRSAYLFDISRSTNPALLGSDDGSGNLSGSGISSGSIDYSAGKVSVTLNSPIEQRLRTLAHVHPGQPRNLGAEPAHERLPLRNDRVGRWKLEPLTQQEPGGERFSPGCPR